MPTAASTKKILRFAAVKRSLAAVSFGKSGTGGTPDVDAKSIQGTPVQDVDPAEADDGLFSVADISSPTGFAYVKKKITQDMIQPGVSITSFVLGGGTAKEIGQHLVNPPFTASFSTAPTSVTIQRIGGAIVDVTLTPTSFSYTGDFFHTTNGQSETFRITAIMNGVTKTADIVVTWEMLVFFGVSTDPGVYDEAFIEGLASSGLQVGRGRTMTPNAGAGEFLFVWYPTVLGAITWTVPPVEITPDNLGTVLRDNAFGITNIAGTLYRVSPSGLGLYTVVTS